MKKFCLGLLGPKMLCSKMLRWNPLSWSLFCGLLLFPQVLFLTTSLTAQEAELNQARPSQSQSDQAEPSQAGPDQVESSQAEPNQAEQSQVKSTQAEPSQSQSDEVGQDQVGPSQAGQGQTDSDQTEQSQAGPSQAGQDQVGPSQAEPSQAEPNQAGDVSAGFAIREASAEGQAEIGKSDLKAKRRAEAAARAEARANRRAKARAKTKKIIESHKTLNEWLAEQGIFYWHLNLRYINDFQNGNIEPGLDDRYTYGAAALVSLNNWDFSFDYRALTDRYSSQTRIDELLLNVAYNWGNLLNPGLWSGSPRHFDRRAGAQYSRALPFYLGLTFGLNYLGAGNLSGQFVQNKLHKLSQVPQVFGDYLDDINTLGFQIKVYFSYAIPFKGLFASWEDARLELGVSSSFGLDIGYRETLGLSVQSKLYSGNNYVQLEFHLRQMGYFGDYAGKNTVTKLWQDTVTAPWFVFSSRAGLYQRSVEMNFGSSNNSGDSASFGFGSFEFSWQSLHKKKVFKEPDYSHSFMAGVENNYVLDRFAFMFDLAGRIPVDLSFIALRDLSADPRLFIGKPLARKQESAWLLLADVRPTLNLQSFGYLEFYAGIGLGFLTLGFLVPTDDNFNAIQSREFLQQFAFAAQAGIRWYGLALRPEGSVYGVEVSLLTILPFSDMSNNVRFSDVNLIVENLRPILSLFVGVSILVDL